MYGSGVCGETSQTISPRATAAASLYAAGEDEQQVEVSNILQASMLPIKECKESTPEPPISEFRSNGMAVSTGVTCTYIIH